MLSIFIKYLNIIERNKGLLEGYIHRHFFIKFNKNGQFLGDFGN